MHRAEALNRSRRRGCESSNKPLHRTVLAKLAVQNGQHEVQTDRFVLPLLQDKQSVDALSGDSMAGGTAVFPACVRAVTKLPSTALRNPDPERFILSVSRCFAISCARLDGDGMFFGQPRI